MPALTLHAEITRGVDGAWLLRFDYRGGVIASVASEYRAFRSEQRAKALAEQWAGECRQSIPRWRVAEDGARLTATFSSAGE